MNQAPYGPPPQQQYLGPPPQPQAAPDARALLQTPAIRGYLKNHIYERVGSVAEIEMDLAMIRALTARSKSRGPLFLLALLASLGLGVLLAAQLRNPPASPAALATGVVLAIVLGVFWAMQPTHLPRRVELTSGVIKRLALEPGSQLNIKLDLEDIDVSRKKRIDRNEGGWSVTYHHDDWLLLEGRIVGEVAFRYTRGESRKQAVHVEVRGNTRITRTRTEGWFHDAVALRFAPDGFPGAATLGPEAYKKLKLPEGFETKHFLGQPGMLELTITSDRKWDAGQPGQTLDGADGVKFAGIWFSILFDLLGALRQPFDLDNAPPPSPQLKLDIIDRVAVVGTVTHPIFAASVLGLPALFSIWMATYDFDRASYDGSRASRERSEAKRTRDAKTRAAARRRASEASDDEDRHLLYAWLEIAGGIVLIGGGATAAALLHVRRKKKAAQEASPVLFSAPAGPPPGAYPGAPPGAYPGAPPSQGGYPGGPG
jgi:hypothetical protein